MGIFDRLVNKLGIKKKEVHVMVVGLNNSGKSTLLNQLKTDDDKITNQIIPTVGFTVEKFKHHNVSFTAFDMSGQSKYRELWQRYYRDCEGIVFVIDSSDKLRLAVIKEELNLLIQHPEISCRSIPVLFFANKKDLRETMSSVKIASILQLEQIQDKPWLICSSNALTGEGLQEGLEWFTQQLCENLK